MKRKVESRGKARRPSQVRMDEEMERFWGLKIKGGRVCFGPGKSLKRYRRPKTRAEFLRDVEIGKVIAAMPNALPVDVICGKFGLTRKQFEKRAKELELLVLAGRDQLTRKFLYEMAAQIHGSLKGEKE